MFEKIKQFFKNKRETKKPLIEKIYEKSLAKRQCDEKQITVAVPDIKEYLAKEYERVNALKLINEGLEQELEQSRETETKYKATLVTLDEYCKRLKQAESDIESQKIRAQNAREDLKAARDEINSYRIKFNNIAITKKEIESEIVEEIKTELILIFNSQKGNLSKKSACEIIGGYKKGGA